VTSAARMDTSSSNKKKAPAAKAQPLHAPSSREKPTGPEPPGHIAASAAAVLSKKPPPTEDAPQTRRAASRRAIPTSKEQPPAEAAPQPPAAPDRELAEDAPATSAPRGATSPAEITSGNRDVAQPDADAVTATEAQKNDP
jgi:hypothetical protein